MEFKLIIKKLNNTLTPEEDIIFSKWYKTSKSHKTYFDNVKANYKSDPLHIDVENGWNALEGKISRHKLKSNYWKYAVAASIIIFLSITVMLYTKNVPVNSPVVVDNNIEIGTDKATLTLESGTNIVLEKGQNYQTKNLNSNGKELIYNAENSKETEVMYNYLTIPRGGEFYVQLADGTKVWLNSETKLKYPVKFLEGQTRHVELVYGEAFFEVSPSTNHNGSEFKVNTQIQEVSVLGTQFNVKAYKGENTIYTTLVEGKVEVGNFINKRILKPNQQSKVNLENNEIELAQVDIYNETSWRKGVFSFKNKPLKDIMKVLSRWYDTDVAFENNELENIKFNGVLSKKQNIENILLTIKTTTNFDYEINENKITIK